MFSGVCRKIKLAYGKRGHGHCDNDANMGIKILLYAFICNYCYTGTAARNIVKRPVQTFEIFESVIKETFSNRVLLLFVFMSNVDVVL